MGLRSSILLIHHNQALVAKVCPLCGLHVPHRGAGAAAVMEHWWMGLAQTSCGVQQQLPQSADGQHSQLGASTGTVV